MVKINEYRREFYGRCCSFIKQIKNEFAYLEEARKIMKNFPNVKTGMFTVCIAGFPNVGKTTLLSKITTAKPEIKDYAFTTKSLNMGYIKDEKHKVQVIDTPGTLNRFDKMNNVEKQAYLAIRHCADIIVYVFDFTEPYPMEEQEKLLATIKDVNREKAKPIMIYLSKADILDKTLIEKHRKQLKAFSDSNALKEELLKLSEKYKKEE